MSGYDNYIFGYGSLVDAIRLSQFLERKDYAPNAYKFCRLQGYRRSWNIARDNLINLKNYSYFVDPETRERPAVCITPLNVRPTPDGSIAGLLFGVNEAELAWVDQRERNYKRVEVGANIEEHTLSAPVWLYIGLPEAEECYQQAISQNKAVITKQYYKWVYTAFQAYGDAALADYLATTDKPEVPIRDLTRVRT